MSEKVKNNRGISLSIGVCLLCIMVFCVIPVQAGHWSGIGANGQYDVTYTSNGDGSATISGAAVGPGGSIEQLTDPCSGSIVQDGGPELTGVTQNLILEGPSGWAEVIAKDVNENEAHAEVEFTDGRVLVFQHAGTITAPLRSTELYGVTEPVVESVTGVEAEQFIWSRDFSTIGATSYSFNADGSTAAVSAGATSSRSEEPTFGESGGCGSSRFFVIQGTGASTLVMGEPVDTYFGDYRYEPPTYAYQFGSIENADTAGVAAGSSIPQGFSTLISGTVIDGSLHFDMDAAAGQRPFVGYGTPVASSYMTTADGEIEARGESGTASAISTGPSGQYANVISSFERNYRTRNNMDFDLSASGKIYENGYNKIKTENEIYRPHGYSGAVTATNSEDTVGESVDFAYRHNYGGVAGLTSTGGEWAHVWPGPK